MKFNAVEEVYNKVFNIKQHLLCTSKSIESGKKNTDD